MWKTNERKKKKEANHSQFTEMWCVYTIEQYILPRFSCPENDNVYLSIHESKWGKNRDREREKKTQRQNRPATTRTLDEPRGQELEFENKNDRIFHVYFLH